MAERCHCLERDHARPQTRLEQITNLLVVSTAAAFALGMFIWLAWIREPEVSPPPPEHPAAYNFEAIARDGDGGTVYKVTDGPYVCYFYRSNFPCMERHPDQ